MARTRSYTVRTKRRKLKKGRLFFLLSLCAFLLMLTLSIRFLNALNSMQDQSAWASALPAVDSGETENILVYSVSDKNGGTVTCITLSAYHPANKTFNTVNIPVDTLVEADEFGFMRLAHTYGAGGHPLLVETVSRLFGVPVHTYVQIDEVFLPTALDLVDTETVLETLAITNGGDILNLIHSSGLTAGQHLEQRRLILAALSGEVLDAGLIGKLRMFLRVSPLIATNMSWRTFLSRMDQFHSVAYSDAVTVTLLPGREDVQADGSYWLPDIEELPTIALWLENPNATVPRSQTAIEVLNGSGVSGVAGSVADMLRDEGYQVVHIGNADHNDYEDSRVISRTENMDAARDIAVLIPNAQLLKEELPENGVHVTVIVGKNYNREE